MNSRSTLTNCGLTCSTRWRSATPVPASSTAMKAPASRTARVTPPSLAGVAERADLRDLHHQPVERPPAGEHFARRVLPPGNPVLPLGFPLISPGELPLRPHGAGAHTPEFRHDGPRNPWDSGVVPRTASTPLRFTPAANHGFPADHRHHHGSIGYHHWFERTWGKFPPSLQPSSGPSPAPSCAPSARRGLPCGWAWFGSGPPR